MDHRSSICNENRMRKKTSRFCDSLRFFPYTLALFLRPLSTSDFCHSKYTYNTIRYKSSISGLICFISKERTKLLDRLKLITFSLLGFSYFNGERKIHRIISLETIFFFKMFEWSNNNLFALKFETSNHAKTKLINNRD